MNKFLQRFKSLFLWVPLRDQILFAKHLSLMVKSGMPILDSLRLIKKQSQSKSFSKILNQLVTNVERGQFLSAGLDQYRHVFGVLFLNIIRVGEASGTLAENLNYLAEELQKKQELVRKIKGAMLYPIIVLITMIVIVSLLMFFVFPKLSKVFSDLKVPLPLVTRILININNFVLQKWLVIIVLAIGILFVFWLILKIKKIRFYYHHLLLKLPIFGPMAVNINMANFTRTFGILLKSGIKIVESLAITAESLSNSVYQRELKKAAEEISKGEQIYKYFSKRTSIFPIMISQMIEVGESTGNLTETLFYLSDFYETEVDNTTKNLSNILEPILLLVMGAIVGFVVLSTILPIYKITRSLSL